MSLRAFERRAFVEDILDIKIFSFMNQIVKTKNNKIKEDLKLNTINSKNILEKAKLQKSHITRLEELLNAGTKAVEDKISINVIEINGLEKSNVILEIKLQDLRQTQQTMLDRAATQQKIIKLIDRLETEISKIQKDVSKIENTSFCHSCNQEILNVKKEEILTPLLTELTDKQTKLDLLFCQLQKYDTAQEELSEYNTKVTKLNAEISNNNSNITRYNREIDKLKEELLQISSSELLELKEELRETAITAINLKTEQSKLNEETEYNLIMLELFNDSGIKSKIVEQYIPIINSLVNSYLEKFDFFVSFNLDSEFNETIKSRHRDAFSYNSFSAGEKARIDISILFAFRQLAKLRNSFDCNLLLLDEIADASTDSVGIKNLIKIFSDEEFVNSNIVVISHGNKERFVEAFDGCLEVYKDQNFTQIKDISE
jgi:RNA polymerase-binding transcription factor DksA